jgi:hypothetical protein
VEEHSTAHNPPVLIDESMEVETWSIVGTYLGPASLGGLLTRRSAEVGKAASLVYEDLEPHRKSCYSRSSSHDERSPCIGLDPLDCRPEQVRYPNF